MSNWTAKEIETASSDLMDKHFQGLIDFRTVQNIAIMRIEQNKQKRKKGGVKKQEAPTRAVIEIETNRINTQAVVDKQKQEAVNRRWLHNLIALIAVGLLVCVCPLGLGPDSGWCYVSLIAGVGILVWRLLSGDLQLWGKQK